MRDQLSSTAVVAPTKRYSRVFLNTLGQKQTLNAVVSSVTCVRFPCAVQVFELHATNKSLLAEQALRYIQLLYEVESEVRDLEPYLRHRKRQEKAVPVMDALHAWMIAQRKLLNDGSAIAKALDYNL